MGCYPLIPLFADLWHSFFIIYPFTAKNTVMEAKNSPNQQQQLQPVGWNVYFLTPFSFYLPLLSDELIIMYCLVTLLTTWSIDLMYFETGMNWYQSAQRCICYSVLWLQENQPRRDIMISTMNYYEVRFRSQLQYPIYWVGEDITAKSLAGVLWGMATPEQNPKTIDVVTLYWWKNWRFIARLRRWVFV